ncbi:MAG: hypothetical protein PHO92_03870 [Candidatus Peribacteraceae bacterium]|nr:hypothetical protein [Candidatus Peribacteraceae bacterium]
MEKCVFCGSGISSSKRAREDVVPKWLAEILSLRKEKICPTHFSEDGKVISDRNHVVGQLLCGNVCGNCNNGWMSQLETSNQGVIKSLIRGQNLLTLLSDDEASQLAFWSCKTAFALHAASNYRNLIPEEHFHSLSQGKISKNIVVMGNVLQGDKTSDTFLWVQSPSWFISQSEREISDEELQQLRNLGYKICLQFGSFIILVAHNPLPNTKCLFWYGVHIPVHPRHGPVTWMQNVKREFPDNDPFKTVCIFHQMLGLATSAQVTNQ